MVNQFSLKHGSCKRRMTWLQAPCFPPWSINNIEIGYSTLNYLTMCQSGGVRGCNC